MYLQHEEQGAACARKGRINQSAIRTQLQLRCCYYYYCVCVRTYCSTQQQSLLYFLLCTHSYSSRTPNKWRCGRGLIFCYEPVRTELLRASCWLVAAGFCALPAVITNLGLPRKGAKQPVTRSQSSIDGAKQEQLNVEHTIR